MSLGQLRTCLLFGKTSRALLPQSQRVCPVGLEGQRNLTTDPAVYRKAPYPYQTKKFNFFRGLIDFTSSRLNENSVIIAVDGPPCSGKTELAKNIAEEFNLSYLRGPTEKDIFVENGFDLRDLNVLLDNPKMREYDMEMMLNETDPSKGRIMHRTQMKYFQWKFRAHVDALRHVLSTGQGVVVENSVWADAVWFEALYKLGYLSRNSIRYYKEYRANAIHELWKPQLVLHIENSTPSILEQMRSKNPNLAKAPGLNEGFVDTLKDTYKKSYLPYMNEFAEVLSYDVTDLPDLDLLTIDLEKMDLANVQEDKPARFSDWRKTKEEYYSLYRLYMFSEEGINAMLSQGEPTNLPEENLSGEEYYDLEDLTNTIPQLRYCKEVFYHPDGTPRTDKATQDLIQDSPFAPATLERRYTNI